MKGPVENNVYKFITVPWHSKLWNTAIWWLIYLFSLINIIFKILIVNGVHGSNNSVFLNSVILFYGTLQNYSILWWKKLIENYFTVLLNYSTELLTIFLKIGRQILLYTHPRFVTNPLFSRNYWTMNYWSLT